MSDYAIELRGIDKWFGPVHANDAINLAVPRGSIFGLVGENGAGKSTLMSILYGFYQADAGQIFIDGQPRTITSPSQAIEAGIGLVFQDLKLVANMSVLDNLMLGREGGLALAKGRQAARRLLLELAGEHQLYVDPDAIVQDLPLGLQQRVEILKQLYRGADILILDEPTDVLTPQEAEAFFAILQDLQGRGVTSVFITHKLKEILAITSEVAVIRRGKIVGQIKTAETNAQQLADLMVGRALSAEVQKNKPTPNASLQNSTSPVLLEVKGLTKSGQGRRALNDISLSLHAGEILGIAGIAGNGQTELLEVLSGLAAYEAGEVMINGQAFSGKGDQTAWVRAQGLAHVPEDRQKFGLVARFTATEVSALGYQDRTPFSGTGLRRGLMRWAAALDQTAAQMESFDVRPRNPRLPAGSFSGGNQQKLVLSRELTKGARVLLVGQPTRGVDVGAIAFIHAKLLEQRAAGAGILLVSGELEELMDLADRILVLFEGRIVGQMAASAATQSRLGLLMAGTGAQA